MNNSPLGRKLLLSRTLACVICHPSQTPVAEWSQHRTLQLCNAKRYISSHYKYTWILLHHFKLNGSRQQSRKYHSKWNFQVCQIHPNFASRPVSCEKMLLCYFFSLKAGRKDLTNRPKVLSSPPPPPPPTPHCSSLLKKCWIWIHKIWTPCATQQRRSCVVFSLKAGRKDLTNRPKVLTVLWHCRTAGFNHDNNNKNDNNKPAVQRYIRGVILTQVVLVGLELVGTTHQPHDRLGPSSSKPDRLIYCGLNWNFPASLFLNMRQILYQKTCSAIL